MFKEKFNPQMIYNGKKASSINDFRFLNIDILISYMLNRKKRLC